MAIRRVGQLTRGGFPPENGRFLLRIFAALAASALIGGACAEPAPVEPAWPEGNLLVARTTALRRLLEHLSELEGTPVGRRAALLLRALPGCDWVEANSTANGELWSTLECFDPSGDLAGLDRTRGEADIAFVLAGPANDRAVGTLTIAEAGDVAAEILLPESRFTSARALLLPDREAAGPTLLNRADELAHARLRPEGGIDIASLVPASSQADRMFQLKSEIFAGTVLDGTWEAALYLPEPGRPMPRAALAVGFAFREPAVRAMEGFLSELRSAWPLHRSDFAIGSAQGACLLDLKLMPDFAPCYAATENALVIGWNAASVRKALADESRAGQRNEPPQSAHALSLELARFPDADAHFAELEPDTAQLVTTNWPWRRLTADGEREAGAVRVRIRLDGGSGA
jgi:hypothetical protein